MVLPQLIYAQLVIYAQVVKENKIREKNVKNFMLF